MSSPSTAPHSRAWVEVDLDALGANARRVGQTAGAGVALVPMVKADAYGVGVAAAVGALRRALAPGPWAFGVATVAEGEAVRALGWDGRVLVFSPTPPAEYARAAASRLTLCLSEIDAVRRWREAADAAGARLGFHTEVDTGMGRAGFGWRQADAWGGAVAEAAAGALDWEGCFTHFHSADEPDLAPTHEQWARFRFALAALPEAGAAGRAVHVANSAAALRCAGFGCDLVRPGIALYGGAAGPGVLLEPVVALRARLSLVREVEAGTTVGYGATHTAARRERWGTVAIGYGDGLRRALAAGGGEALVHGRRVPIVGRISMDMTTLDLSAVPDAAAGDVVTLIGRDGDERIALDEVAARCGTISYEVLAGLTGRLPRVYRGDGGAAVG